MLRPLIAVLALLAAPAFAEVEVEEVTSPGGIEAWLIEDHTLPFLALEIRFEGGTALDPEGRRGAVNLMTATLEEGAADMDATAFAQAREALAASFEFDSYSDAVSVSAAMLTENREEAVEILRAALVEPRFDQGAIDRVRGQVLSIIRSDETDPQALAARAFAEAAFPGHPYGSADDGTAESVAALTREDIVEAHRAAIARDWVYVGAAGDITAEELGALLDELLGALPETGAPRPDRAEIALEPGVEVIEFDIPQSIILFGHEGIARDDDDYLAAYVVDTALGGSGRQSRLMEEVRERRGLTYGIGTGLFPRELGDLYQGSLSTANPNAGEVIEVVRDEFERIAEEGLTEDELAEVKEYLTGAYPLRFDGNGALASIAVGMQMVGLGPDYIAERNDLVDALTLEEVNRVASELIRPEELSFVVVGRPEGIEGAVAD
ncbi:zinc protease [Hasllibacter halocynthiae]|uniref:Zinc protease n=1 Tax=Hasllibacter halocynthiae TaxID=595589 RepID=A0A2T0X3X4_9RHOB|nr:pitrilysin family protein [Hasllibacter halocynthiae]PRY93564.1 zinc protease [Hasllibacter halocynthiae]